MFQKENFWNSKESFVVGGGNSPLPLPPFLSHALAIFSIDSPEIGLGRIFGPSGPSVSDIAPPPFKGRHSSNRGAIVGGVIGGIAVISILIAALFLYRRRRRSLAPSPVFDGDIPFDPHMDQVSSSQSIPSPGTVSSCVSETPASLSRPYVHILIFFSSSACVCSHDYLFVP